MHRYRLWLVRASHLLPLYAHVHPSDYNHTDRGGKCVLAEFESIPAGACLGDTLSQTYLTTSGYRLTPGNLCKKEGGVIKDEPIVKKCSEGAGTANICIIETNK